MIVKVSGTVEVRLNKQDSFVSLCDALGFYRDIIYSKNYIKEEDGYYYDYDYAREKMNWSKDKEEVFEALVTIKNYIEGTQQ